MERSAGLLFVLEDAVADLVQLVHLVVAESARNHSEVMTLASQQTNLGFQPIALFHERANSLPKPETGLGGWIVFEQLPGPELGEFLGVERPAKNGGSILPPSDDGDDGDQGPPNDQTNDACKGIHDVLLSRYGSGLGQSEPYPRLVHGEKAVTNELVEVPGVFLASLREPGEGDVHLHPLPSPPEPGPSRS